MVGIEAFISHSPLEGVNDIAHVMSDSEYKRGVSFTGPWSAEADGFNEHIRRSSRALYEAGCPVHLRSPGPHVMYGAPKELDQKLKPMLTASISRYSVAIHQTILSPAAIHALVMHPQLTPEELEVFNRHKVIYTVFEKDYVHPDTIRAMNLVGQVWVACKLNAEVLASSGVSPEKIRVVPLPFFKDDPLLKLRNRTRKPGPVRFYHIGKWEPRKAQDKILEAFLLAFSPGQAQLCLRCSSFKEAIKDYPSGPVEAIRRLLRDPDVQANGWTSENIGKGVEIIGEKLSNEGIVKLHEIGDVYVTLSRGEGFDMPSFDAKIAGNLVIHTPSGGPIDFCDTGDVLVPASGKIPCHPFYRWDPEARYVDFDIAAATYAFLYARDKARQLRLVEDHSLGPLEAFKSEVVGINMLKNLEDLVGPDGKVYEK
jgi:glycosyltransferase involved in cell wall biosynthesis